MRAPVGAPTPTPPPPFAMPLIKTKLKVGAMGRRVEGVGVVNKNDFLQFPFSNAFK